MNYKVKHLGEGQFIVKLDDTGEIKECGPNIIGMIRYTYFEDYQLPPKDWEITQQQLLKDYQPKVMKDIAEGKIKFGKHNFGETDWIQIKDK